MTDGMHEREKAIPVRARQIDRLRLCIEHIDNAVAALAAPTDFAPSGLGEQLARMRLIDLRETLVKEAVALAGGL